MEEGFAEDEDGESCRDGAHRVPAGRRGEEREPEEVHQILRDRSPGDVIQRAGRDAFDGGPCDEGPEPQIHQRTVGIRRDDGDDDHRDELRLPLEPARDEASGEPHPAGDHHLEREPRPDACGQQGRSEERQMAEQESETRAERSPGNDEQEEHALDPCRASTQRRTQHGVDRGQHSERRESSGVESTFRDLRQHQQQHERHEGSEDEGGLGAVIR